MSRTLITLVEDKPGVLNRVTSLFRRRNFNIASLNVGRTEKPDVSRMTILLDSDDGDARLVEANLYKLVNVIDVQDVTDYADCQARPGFDQSQSRPRTSALKLLIWPLFSGEILLMSPRIQSSSR